MSKNSGTVKVKVIPGEAFRYYVESWQSRTEPHLVDLTSYHGNGRCSCKDFETNCWRNMKAQLGIGEDKIVSHEEMEHLSRNVRPVWYGTPNDINPLRTTCRHNVICRRYSIDYILKEVSHGQRSN